MGSWADRFGKLTVEQAQELNNAAKATCEFEITSQGGNDNESI